MTCLNQIRGTSVVDEIIVVDDRSEIPLPEIEGVRVIRNITNVGVGASFDVGVEAARGDNIILTACDMRFADNNWLSLLVSDIEANPKSLICTSCVVLGEADQQIRPDRKKSYGATILFYHDRKTNPKKHRKFRGIIEAQWYPKQKETIYQIPCILGACYGVKKSWYQHIDGFWGHRKWGTLEPYISLKSWMFGGSCLIDPRIETGHIFKRAGAHGVVQDDLYVNKMIVSKLLFPDSDKMIRFLGNNASVQRATTIVKSIEHNLLLKREGYREKTVYPIESFVERWGIDFNDRNP